MMHGIAQFSIKHIPVILKTHN